ncbi:Urea ABC transporter, ATPase protein UrtD [Caballeronia sordidicola]|uniref:Urea ABC transporter, ATPase protein UrtD n=1 Tax=Caballeronia sordidicola TaxID=196367 RepID=A0A242MQY6_CABSO|nr:Urea ABC transporter, ATPase protein UrtD [Caballeronia sordidicola]
MRHRGRVVCTASRHYQPE